jgi:hypothetical protein
LNTNAVADEAGRFYTAQEQSIATHLALRWNGRVRFTVPREAAAQQVCWRIFRPGRLAFPMRAMARLPHLSGAVSCVEAEPLASIREEIGREAGPSCCRAGTPGVWSKDTILFLKQYTIEPLYIVKAGSGVAVDSLLRNEADWLQTLGDQASLVDHIPKLVAHRSRADLSFVAESPLTGKVDYRFGESHVTLLHRIQEHSRQIMRLEDSRLYRNLRSRLTDLNGLLSKAWSVRFETAMRRIEQSLSASPVLLVAAHNDFAPWNIRIERGVARIFDWEYADYEQLPLFDPLHFILMPMALKHHPAAKMIKGLQETLLLCSQWPGKEFYFEPQIQALAYLTNLCAFYLWSVRGASEVHPVLDSYSGVIDHLCLQ